MKSGHLHFFPLKTGIKPHRRVQKSTKMNNGDKRE